MYPETDTQAGYGSKGMPQVSVDNLTNLNSQTTEMLAQCVELAKSLNDRLSGPRPEAVANNAMERPFDGNALAAARSLRDLAQEVQNQLHRAHQAL